MTESAIHNSHQFRWIWPERTLVLAGAPIGNIGDASHRLCEALLQATIIAAEDTRKTKKLIHHLGIDLAADVRIVAYHDHNEEYRATELVHHIMTGEKVLVIPDAGMPLTSDPGHAIVRQALEEDLAITVIPGPSAVSTALALSGLKADRFRFDGFVPKKPSQIHQRFAQLAHEEVTMIFFDSPHRIAETIDIAIEYFGETRPAALCRELTKMFETVYRGSLQELYQQVKEGVKGELVLLIEGCQEKVQTMDIEQAAQAAQELAEEKGLRVKEAAKIIAEEHRLRPKDVFQATLYL